MIKVNLLKPIKLSQGRGALTGVRQFVALMVVFFVLVLSFGTFAQERCDQVFTQSHHVSLLDTRKNAKSYYSMIHKYGKKVPKKLTITLNDGSTMQVKTPENLRPVLDPMKGIDIGLMGYLGKVFDLKYDRETKKPTSKISEYYYKEELAKARARVEKAPAEPSAEFVAMMSDLLHVEKVDGGFITLKIDLADRSNDSKPQLIRNIRNRFMTSYLHLVNWSYRISGLEKNKALSNLNMMDEMGEIFVRDYRAFTLHMIFDQKVWHQQLRVLESRVIEYNVAKRENQGEKTQTKILEDISQPIDPYFPLAGVAITHSLVTPSLPMEIKRYFKNDHEDPMKLMELQDKNEFIVRHKMIYKMIERLPQGQQLEIHAHTLVHARAYLKLGFHKAGIIENPQYPGVQVYLLKASREEVLEKIQAILSERK